MSDKAIWLVSQTRGMAPQERLVAYELATLHNAGTGKMNPSRNLIINRTGMTPAEVGKAMDGLVAAGVLQSAPEGWAFTQLLTPTTSTLVPTDWQPQPETVDALQAEYPTHDFSAQEFIHDFINFTRSRNITISAGGIDRAFVRNASALLDRRRPGPVSLSRDGAAKESTSAFGFLARLASGG